jgi:hypothetical protein
VTQEQIIKILFLLFSNSFSWLSNSFAMYLGFFVALRELNFAEFFYIELISSLDSCLLAEKLYVLISNKFSIVSLLKAEFLKS